MKRLFKLFDKYWLHLVCLYLAYVLYSTIKNPESMAMAMARLVNPWYYIPFGSLVVGWCILAIWWKRKSKKEWKILEQYGIDMKKNIAKSCEETALLKENDLPDEESISKYYKMYLKKFELDNVDTWSTEEPIPFDIWEEAAKADKPEGGFPRVRWAFMISMTSDAFMFDPESGHATMMRYRDYEEMI